MKLGYTQDLRNKVFGRIIVLDEEPFNKGVRNKFYWNCRCLSCGLVFETSACTLKRNKYGCARCARKENAQIAARLRNKYTFRPIAYHYNVYKQNAKRRNYDFELTLAEFESLVTKNCVYCNSAPRQFKTARGDISITGLDRIDNNVGYLIGNVVPCCTFCNIGKRHMSAAEWLQIIENIRYTEKFSSDGLLFCGG